MTMKSGFGSSYASLVSALLRIFVFFSLIAILVPFQFAYRFAKPRKPFAISLVFYRLLMKLLGIRLRVHGTLSTASPTLFVSNHASYLDIPVLGAIIPAAFIAKAEVRDWPLIGFLAEQQKTVFIERRATRVSSQRNYLRERLEAGQNLVLFPEGTSSDGLKALPFKSSLFSIVEDMPHGHHVTVQPISITCTELDGLPLTRGMRHLYAWFGDMTFVGHLWNVFKFGHFTVDLVFHEPVTIDHFNDRKSLAAYCQQQVGRGIEQALAGRGCTVENSLKLAPPPKKILLEAKL